MREINYSIIEDNNRKILKSDTHNYIFDKNSGLFMRWGINKETDPTHSLIGPEILDIEISSGGYCKGACSFCYKSNGGISPVQNMTLETYRKIFSKFPKMLTQIAFGIMNTDSNPEFTRMLSYTRSNGVIPNYTCHGLDTNEDDARVAASICGAVAVSVVNKEKTYQTIHKYLEAGCKQINIHYMISEETYERAFEIIDDISNDYRLKNLNAIVFLQYKPKGRGVHYFTPIRDIIKIKRLIEHCNNNNISYGFDSCSSPMVMRAVEKDVRNIVQYIEPCESTLFSGYINWKGEFFPCSFAEGSDEWREGLSILDAEDFVRDIWNHPKIVKFRHDVLNSSVGCKNCIFTNNCRKCVIYKEITSCE